MTDPIETLAVADPVRGRVPTAAAAARMDAGLRVTELERLTTGPGADRDPRVARDGESLVFSTITGVLVWLIRTLVDHRRW